MLELLVGSNVPFALVVGLNGLFLCIFFLSMQLVHLFFKLLAICDIVFFLILFPFTLWLHAVVLLDVSHRFELFWAVSLQPS